MSEESDPADVMCPICTQILIEPVTLVCCHKELCKQCLDHACAQNSLLCPFCRVRLGVWLRKCRSLVNEKRWKELQDHYPEEVRRRLEGSEDDLVSGNEAAAPKIALAKPGEIHEEYEEEKRKFQKEQEEIRKAEEAASRQLIQQLQEEGEALAPEAQRAIEERMRMDEELANRLGKEECALESSDPAKKKPASPTSASQGKLGPLDNIFEAMKQGSAQKGKGDFRASSEARNSSILESKAPIALAGPGRRAEMMLSSAGHHSKPAATATISKAPSSDSESDNESDITILEEAEETEATFPNSRVNSGHHGSNDSVNHAIPSASASSSAAHQQAKIAVTVSKTGSVPEKVVQSKPLFRSSSVPTTSASGASKAAPSGQVRNGNSVGSGSAAVSKTLQGAVPTSHNTHLSSLALANTRGTPKIILSRSDHAYASTVASSSSSSAQTNGGGSPSSHNGSPASILQTVRSHPTGHSHVKPTTQVQGTVTCMSCTNTSSSGLIQVTASSNQGTTTSTEVGRKTNISGSSAQNARGRQYLIVPPLGSGSAAGTSQARDRVATASSNCSGNATAPSSSATTRPVSSAPSPLPSVPHLTSIQKRTLCVDDLSGSDFSDFDLITDDDTDFEYTKAKDHKKQELHKEKPGDAVKQEARISDLLGLHGRPTLPESPPCSSFPLHQPSAKPGRHPDLDLESITSGSVTTDDEMDDNSNWSLSAHSNRSTSLTKDQDSLDDSRMNTQTGSRSAGGPEVAQEEAKGSVDQEEGGRGKGKEAAVSKGKGRGKRKLSSKPASAAKKQKVDKNQPSLHRFFSRQGSSSSSAGPSVERSQEEKDMELALELQKQFDFEVKYRMTANRFKGADNEYSLRETRRKK